MTVCIYGPDQTIHFRRPHNHSDVQEAFGALGYYVRTEDGADVTRCDVCNGTGKIALIGEDVSHGHACIQCNGARVMIRRTGIGQGVRVEEASR